MTLIEVLLVVILALMVLVPFFGWVVTSLWQQASAERSNSNSFALGLTSTYFKRDVGSAFAIASSTADDGSQRADAALVDCAGGGVDAGEGGVPRLAIVTTSKQRIVYSLVDSDEIAGTKELWRRTCANESSPSDATLNDSLLNNAVTTPGVAGVRLATRLDGITTSCPGVGAGTQNPLCPQVTLRATFPDPGTRPSVLRAMRRVNGYAPPGTPPVARITMTIPDDNDPKTVLFSAENSYDPRGQGILSYRWDFDGLAGCPVGPAMAVTATCTFPLGEHQVRLEVVSLEGNVGRAVEAVSMKARRPNVKFLGLPYVNVVRAQSREYQIQFTPYDGATISQYRVSWGDGSTELVWPDNASLTSCTAATGCTVPLQHAYSEQGVFRVSATAIDSNGRSRNRIATVNVESEVLYVRQSVDAVDAVTCGTVTLPCRQISYGLGRAAAEGKKALHVTEGAYGRFDVIGGIDVIGGYTTSFAPGGGVTRVDSFFESGSGRYSAIQATNQSAPTTIKLLKVVGPELAASTSLPVPASETAQAIIVSNSTNITFDTVDVQGQRGPEATGILIDNSRSISLVNSTVFSGEALGGSNSSYGIRVLRTNTSLAASSLSVTGGSITAHLGALARATPSASAPGTNGCRGLDGGNATGPASPGDGGSGGGCIGTQPIGGGAGGRGGSYSGSGSAGAAGASGGGAGGSGGCGSLLGCSPDPGGGAAGAAGARGTVPLTLIIGGVASNPADWVGNGDPKKVTEAPTWAQAVDRGSVGGVGGSGKGGGGGGGGKSASASGGGGGGGGEGGVGGAGGGTPGFPGGGSFGIYAVNSIITLDGNVTITADSGRTGGGGTPGSGGGAGGNGGDGGAKSCCQASAGGGGGGGGAGGGAGASGGPGGPSVAVFQVGAAGQVLATVTGPGKNVNLSVAASAASGGVAGTGGAAGAGGASGSGASNGANAAAGTKGEDGWTGRPGLRYLIWDNGPKAAP